MKYKILVKMFSRTKNHTKYFTHLFMLFELVPVKRCRDTTSPSRTPWFLPLHLLTSHPHLSFHVASIRSSSPKEYAFLTVLNAFLES